MTFGEICVAIGDGVASTFGLLEAGGNMVNYAFMALGFVGLIYWCMRQARYNKEADQGSGWK